MFHDSCIIPNSSEPHHHNHTTGADPRRPPLGAQGGGGAESAALGQHIPQPKAVRKADALAGVESCPLGGDGLLGHE